MVREYLVSYLPRKQFVDLMNKPASRIKKICHICHRSTGMYTNNNCLKRRHYIVIIDIPSSWLPLEYVKGGGGGGGNNTPIK